MGSYSAVAFVMFAAFNSIGFSVSVYMINVLTCNFPLHLKLQICIIAMYCNYTTAMTIIAPDNTKNRRDIQLLHQFLAENPLLLHTLALASAKNPLHVASIAGHVDFVKDIVRIKPDFSKEMSNDGFIAPSILHLPTDIWRSGRVDVIREMALSCQESVADVTIQGETALNLAAKPWWNCSSSSKLEKTTPGKYYLIHLSALEVNNVNHSGLTPLDLLLIFPSEAGDREMEAILRGTGAMRAGDIVHSGIPSHNHPHAPMESDTNPLQQPDNLVEFFKFKKGRDSPSDARDALLVVAVLVATTTYQVAANPPGGGTDILGSYYPAYFIVFAVFNSIGFSMSLHMIKILTTNFPLQLELHVCIVAMYFTYCSSVLTVAPGTGLYSLFLLTPALPRMLQLAAKCARPLVNIIREDEQEDPSGVVGGEDRTCIQTSEK
ncbi:PREDICTED: ankyrin [Prunus dulcis]|uniref:PREDICTED: ankyrin n=1 Tax=Prunus dulcis TaxID=3755 RepID=A0A5E4E4Y4_PRUDU|nr:hypothetical protein L3X38_014657 [Prunus dulcis]VVA10853.1 PREDICTED: ankyrin [Prunus dulcis]